MSWGESRQGGYTLEKHWQKGEALAQIQSRPWDFVVLQDQSQAALVLRDSMFEYARKFDAEIRKRGAKTILYMTWADQERREDQRTISKVYLELSRQLKCLVAPAGDAWDAALKGDPKLVLHREDKHHPNATGRYLTACVLYATIYGKSPEGLSGSAADLSDAEARRLQSIAWKTVLSSKKR